MESIKPLKLPNANYFDRDMFYDISSHSVPADYPLHWHDFYEIEYVQSGHAVQIINGHSFEVQPGSAALLSPVDFHCYQNVSPFDPLKVINIKFSDLILPQNIRSDIYEQHQPVIGRPDQLEALLLKLHDEYYANRYGRDTFIIAGITQICVLLMRDLPEISSAAEFEPRSLIQQAVLYIRSHYRRPITVDEVAGMIHLTPNYFSEYFKKQTGVKFSAYVQKLRLEFAVSLLKMSDLSIKQVADESGFNSAAYFSNAFKDYFGVSPEQFRRSNLRTISPIQPIEKIESDVKIRRK